MIQQSGGVHLVEDSFLPKNAESALDFHHLVPHRDKPAQIPPCQFVMVHVGTQIIYSLGNRAVPA